MKRLISVPILFLITTVGYSTIVTDCQKGADAASRGDHGAALKEWIPLGQNGDAIPKFQLGWIIMRDLCQRVCSEKLQRVLEIKYPFIPIFSHGLSLKNLRVMYAQ